MEPQIRFCSSVDGTRIGFATAGSGAPLVFVNSTYGSLEEVWSGRENLLAELGRHRRVISYDHRGVGASLGDASDLSLEVEMSDLSTVVDHLGIERFDLWGVSESGAICAAYAAQKPDRVARLILWNSCPSGPAIARAGAVEGVIGLIQSNWKLARAAISDMAFPTGPASEKQAAANSLERLGPDKTARRIEFFWSLDVTDYLPRIVAPALVLHRRDNALIPLSAARSLASLIPDARLYVVDGDTGSPLFEYDRYLDVVWEFLGEAEQAAPERQPATLAAVHTILFTDIEGSTTLTQRLGDAKAQELVRAHNTIVRDALKGCGGSEIKHTGDGIMASFPSASRALECAVAIQRSMEQGTGNTGMPVRVRIGLNAGEPVAEDQDLFGTAVQLARRICDHADAGEILVSNVVRELAAGKGFLFADTGEVVLKGFEEPLRLHAVRWREAD